MRRALVPRASATLAVELASGQENIGPDAAVRGVTVEPLSKKIIKGGGRGSVSRKKRGRKKKAVVEEKKENFEENVVMSDIKDVVFVAEPGYDSSGDAGPSVGGESGASEGGDASPTAKRSAGKGVSPKTPSTKKTIAGGRRRARKPNIRRSSAGKSPQKRGSGSTPGKKGKATVEDDTEDNSIGFVEEGYCPDGDNDEDFAGASNASRTPRRPAGSASKRVVGGSVMNDSGGRTTRRTTSGKKALAGAIDTPATRSSTRGKAPIPSDSVHEQRMQDIDMIDGETLEPVRAGGPKRRASQSPDTRFKKAARTAAGKSVGAIKDGLRAMSIGDCDADEADEAGSQFSAAPKTGYSVESGDYEQSPASSTTQARSVVQSEPVIGRDRLRYGGKSVAGLQALWETGLPRHLKK